MITIYYHSDPDGFCSAAIVKKLYPGATAIPFSYGANIRWNKLYENQTVYVLDLTFSPTDMDRLNTHYDLIWIDHHKQKADMKEVLSKDIKGIRDGSKSACLLTWEFTHPNQPPPRVVRYINDYDIWKILPITEDDYKKLHENPLYDLYRFGDPNIIYFIESIFMYNLRPNGGNEALWDLLFADGIFVDTMISYGKKLHNTIKYLNMKFMKDLSYETQFAIGDNMCNIISANVRANSLIFESAMKQHHDAIFQYNWIGYLENYKFSIYTAPNKTHNVNTFAREYRGDGHDSASGFTSEFFPIVKVLEDGHLELREFKQGTMPGSKMKDPTYYDDIKNMIDSDNVIRKYMQRQYEIIVHSAKFTVMLPGNHGFIYDALVVNHPIPWFDLFKSCQLGIEAMYISYVWTNCGKYRVVVHPLIVSKNEVKDIFKVDDVMEAGSSLWFYMDKLPFDDQMHLSDIPT